MPTYDQVEHYETCARVRTYAEHTAIKNYALENTKPIFNKEKILSVYNLYTHHVFIDLFKTFKERQPISLCSLFEMSTRSTSNYLRIPLRSLELSKQNFVCNASSTWNSLIDKVLDSPLTNEKNIVIPGSAKFSDLSSPISVIKSRVKRLLFETQQLKPPGCKIEWLPINRWGCSPQ